jgi:hypothetical protein
MLWLRARYRQGVTKQPGSFGYWRCVVLPYWVLLDGIVLEQASHARQLPKRLVVMICADGRLGRLLG